jgi:glutamate carboxypeptidase
MTEIAAKEREVIDWLAAQDGPMRSLLETLVNIDSGSYNKAGVDRVGEAICSFLKMHAIDFDTIPNDKFGNAIRATVGPPGDRCIMLMGHRDTVYPEARLAVGHFVTMDPTVMVRA